MTLGSIVFNTSTKTPMEQLLDKLRRTKYYYEEDIELIVSCYERCKQHGKFVSESDGQFTGGVYSEHYVLSENEYVFAFLKDGTLVGLTVVTHDS